MGPIQEKIGDWVDSNPPPKGTVFSGQRAGKLLLALFACTAIGAVPKLLLDALAKPKPEDQPIEHNLTMQDLEEADKKGQLGSGFKRILEMRRKEQAK